MVLGPYSDRDGRVSLCAMLAGELAGCVVRVDATYLKGGSYRAVEQVELSVQ